MGGACSRKRDHLVDEGDYRRARYLKNGSSKWLLLSLPRCTSDISLKGQGKCPSLLELCIARTREDINKYNSFSVLPKDISQQIFNELVESRCLTDSSLEAFRDCAIEVVFMSSAMADIAYSC